VNEVPFSFYLLIDETVHNLWFTNLLRFRTPS
jgi:hypothetical protein